MGALLPEGELHHRSQRLQAIKLAKTQVLAKQNARQGVLKPAKFDSIYSARAWLMCSDERRVQRHPFEV